MCVCVCVCQCKLWISCYALSRGTLAWTDEASKRQEVSKSRARKHQLYKQKGLNPVGQKPPLHGGLAEGFLMSTLLYVKRQNINTSDMSCNLCRFSYGQRIVRVMVIIMVITGHGQRAQDVSVSSEQTAIKQMKKNMQPLNDCGFLRKPFFKQIPASSGPVVIKYQILSFDVKNIHTVTYWLLLWLF